MVAFRKIWMWLFLSIFIFSLAGFFVSLQPSEKNFQKKSRKFQTLFLEKEKRVHALVENAAHIFQSGGDILENFATNGNDWFNKDGIEILVYDNDTLKYWSGNSVPMPEIYPKEQPTKGIRYIENGWYYCTENAGNSNYRVVGLLLVKSDFRYQNDYLINKFNKGFKWEIPADISTEEGEFNIFSGEGKFLFSLKPEKFSKLPESKLTIIFFLYFAGFLLLLTFLFKWQSGLAFFQKRQKLLVLCFALEVVILRIIQIILKVPEIIYSSDLFSPLFYASSGVLPSLGDFMVNALLLLAVSWVFFLKIKPRQQTKFKSRLYRYFLIITLFLHIIIFSHIAEQLIRSLVINSSFPFDLNNIFGSNFYTYIGAFIISTLFLSFFLISSRLLQAAISINKGFKEYFLLFLVLIIPYAVYCQVRGIEHLWFEFFLIVFVVIFWFGRRENRERPNLRYAAVFLLLFSLLGTWMLYTFNNIKEKERRKLFAVKLTTDQDPIAEDLFSDLRSGILSDTLLRHYLENIPDPMAEEEARKHLEQNYFTGYWSKFNIQTVICREADVLNIIPSNIRKNCYDYFNESIDAFGNKTLSPGLYFINMGAGQTKYMSALEFFDTLANVTPPVTVFMEFDSKIMSRDLGYPELLIDKEIKVTTIPAEYTYASYQAGELIQQYGKFPYSIHLDSNFTNSGKDFIFLNEGGYSHLYYRPSAEKLVIVSKRSSSLLDFATPFSYMFIILGTYVFLFLLMNGFFYKLSYIALNFKSRLELSVISMMLVSLFLIGVTTVIYIIKINDKKNLENLNEKAHSVLVELEHKLEQEAKIAGPVMKDYVAELMLKFSNVFFSDINLYDLDGQLVASSRPEIFNEGLTGSLIDPMARYLMEEKKLSSFVQVESIGKMRFLSAYVPFRNVQNEAIAYLNLPYFAKQTELRKEISTFLVAFINIYVLLLAIAILVAIIISNYITRPLQLIRDKMRLVRLGKSNEKIEWQKKDEIGSLISEYNRMLDELAESAEILARSERESAWREMAKQVAHEIKNPLTPIRLSVQHLQKAWDEKTENWDERLKRFTTTIIEQIDNLSTIASEFSDFAKMPQARREKIELTAVIESSIELYKDLENITIRFEKDREYNIIADKKQLLRVFNNLIKNAVQAIPPEREGLIQITLGQKDGKVIILMKDNGIGVPKELSTRIFSPNFTTKSAGMGLGLAIVRNIIENLGGEVSFTSGEDKGTTFKIILPVFEEQ